MLEREFQKSLIEKIKDRFLGCIVLKNDPTYLQGFPDLTILYGKNWGVIECKKSAHEDYRPNQRYYLAKTNAMSFSATAYPGNEEDVLNAMEQAFRA